MARDLRDLIIQKFGGTSVGSIERIQHVAQLVQKNAKKSDLIVVVSAMAGQTNRLIEMSHEISSQPFPEAYDLLLATGEQVSCALLSIALRKIGIKALPLIAHQVGIRTDALFTNARIKDIDSSLLKKLIADGFVPVVAGFQGVDDNGFITTLGRGGSDTSAVALAIATQAKRCDIYTDVDGVYTADPRLVPHAKKIDQISFQEMLELASLGAKVLHMRSVELAAKYKMPLTVLSTFTPDVPGTSLVEETNMLESPVVSAVTADSGQCLVSLKLSPNRGEARYPARFFKPLSEAGINVDVIIESAPDASGTTTINFTVNRRDGERARTILADYKPKIELDSAVKVSIVGLGMRSHTGVAAKIFETLEKLEVPVHLVTTSEITVSVLIDEIFKEKTVRGLHDAFNLGGPAA